MKYQNIMAKIDKFGKKFYKREIESFKIKDVTQKNIFSKFLFI